MSQSHLYSGPVLHMERWLIPALVALVLSACASIDPRLEEPTAKAELITFQDTWVEAEIQGDAETLRSLMDERFLSTSSSGETTGREEYIDWITSLDVWPFTADLVQVELHGDTAILVTLIGGSTKITWVAQRRNGRWIGLEQTFMHVKESDE